MSSSYPTNTDDVIDSRDIISRLEELQELKDSLDEAQSNFDSLADDATDEEREEAQQALDNAESDFSDDEAEYNALVSLADEASGYADGWTYGATLIRESYFTEYCQELLQDIGDLPRDLPGYLVIDWEATADNLKVDYTEVDFDGETYFIR